jgi:hypothetical protein
MMTKREADVVKAAAELGGRPRARFAIGMRSLSAHTPSFLKLGASMMPPWRCCTSWRSGADACRIIPWLWASAAGHTTAQRGLDPARGWLPRNTLDHVVVRT